jgi:2-dehydropantoate 2-reductase
VSPRILVVGAGAIGGVTAARLARAGADVVVLDAFTEHVHLMRDPGLLFDELGTQSRVRIAAVDRVEELEGRFDFALVTLKATHLTAALQPLAARGLVDTYVSLGNGLVQDEVARLVGADRLLVGTVEWGATNLGPGAVRQTTVAPYVIGEVDGRRSDRVLRLARALEDIGEVRVPGQVLGQIWAKLLLNSTFSGLGAVSGLLYGEVAADPVGRQVAFRLWTEGYDVARTAVPELGGVVGVRPDRLVVRSEGDIAGAQQALEQVMSRLAATKASMLQDLERGVPTEVDVINGGVVSAARRHGLPTPLNARVVELVHACEQSGCTPDRSAFDELATVAGLH